MSFRGVALVGIVVLLVGCGGKTYAPVSDRSLSTASQPRPDTYVVRKGDTLYSIAFRYGLDYRALAAQNGISRSYSIYPGQRLKLKSNSPSANSESIVRDASIKAPSPVITSSRKSQQAKPSIKNDTNRTAKPVVEKPKPANPKPAPVRKTSVVKAAGPIVWQWPASGRVIASFKTKGKVNKGINLAGSLGSPVKASANGRVVYAGNGLLGYGNLVIVEHSQQYLSAYAHNSRVLVKENDMVKSGQKIAEMGRSGADRVMLHFEIRRDGKPINPLRFLPKR